MPYVESPSPHVRPHVSWPLLKASLWMRAGIGGAGAALVAPALIATGEATPAAGVLALAGGAVVAAWAWHRTKRLLGDDSLRSVHESGPSAARHGRELARGAPRPSMR
jgi:hypothetical protein